YYRRQRVLVDLDSFSFPVQVAGTDTMRLCPGDQLAIRHSTMMVLAHRVDQVEDVVQVKAAHPDGDTGRCRSPSRRSSPATARPPPASSQLLPGPTRMRRSQVISCLASCV